jgi:hypothetical protein
MKDYISPVNLNVLRQRRELMKRIFGIVAILLLASGIASGTEYWHFGAGVRLTGVMPGSDYSNALGTGLLLTFGNPDSRFTTQFDIDNWKVTYNKSDSLVENSPLGTPDSLKTYKKRDYEYFGVGVGAFEKYRFFDFSPKFSSYVIGGLGGYFLNRKREVYDSGILSLKSDGMHSLFQLAGGIGFEGKINQHISTFIEGRYVAFLNGKDADKNLFNGYWGIHYTF